MLRQNILVFLIKLLKWAKIYIYFGANTISQGLCDYWETNEQLHALASTNYKCKSKQNI